MPSTSRVLQIMNQQQQQSSNVSSAAAQGLRGGQNIGEVDQLKAQVTSLKEVISVLE